MRRAGRRGRDRGAHYARDAAAAGKGGAAVTTAGGTAHAVQGDISTAAGAGELVAGVEADIGPIAILVNNAGITRDKSDQ